MAWWDQFAVSFLQQLREEDEALARIIFASIMRLERKPSLGQYAQGTRYYYTDEEYGFTIGYNYHLEAKSGEIEVVYILEKTIECKEGSRTKENQWGREVV